MPEIDYPEVEQEVRRLAAERPDYVYESPYSAYEEDDEFILGPCRYQHGNGVPGCIFGHAFLNLELPLTDEYEGKAAYEVLESMGFTLSDSQALWAGDVQAKQDSGFTWADAIRAADEEEARRELSLRDAS